MSIKKGQVKADRCVYLSDLKRVKVYVCVKGTITRCVSYVLLFNIYVDVSLSYPSFYQFLIIIFSAFIFKNQLHKISFYSFFNQGYSIHVYAIII